MNDRLEFKAALTVDEAGAVTGIAWPFGSPDRVGDLIQKGAFRAPARLPMLFAHDQGQAVGVWDEIAETAEGLTVKGRLLVNDVERAREVRALVREGAATGLSIGFVTKQAKARPGGGRTIAALELHEISIVAVPSHPAARITSMKSAGTDGTATPNREGHKMENEELEQKAADPVVAAEELKALKARLDKIEAKANRPKAANDNHPTADNDNVETKAFLDFVRTGDATEIKTLNAGTPSAGGVTVPDTLASRIIERVIQFSPIRGLADAVSMSGPLLKLPRLVDEITVGEVDELEARPPSETTFEGIDLQPFEQAVTIPVSRVLLEDSGVDIESFLVKHAGKKFGEKESAWFVTGNGVSQAEGVITNAEIPVMDTAGELHPDHMIDLFYGLKEAYRNSGAWLMNGKTLAVVRKFKDLSGRYLWEPAVAAGQPATILGRPVYEAVHMPDAANDNTPVIFGSFGDGYMIGDRVVLQHFRDEFTGADNGIVKLRFRRRVGGRVILPEALAKLRLTVAA